MGRVAKNKQGAVLCNNDLEVQTQTVDPPRITIHLFLRVLSWPFRKLLAFATFVAEKFFPGRFQNTTLQGQAKDGRATRKEKDGIDKEVLKKTTYYRVLKIALTFQNTIAVA